MRPRHVIAKWATELPQLPRYVTRSPPSFHLAGFSPGSEVKVCLNLQTTCNFHRRKLQDGKKQGRNEIVRTAKRSPFSVPKMLSRSPEKACRRPAKLPKLCQVFKPSHKPGIRVMTLTWSGESSRRILHSTKRISPPLSIYYAKARDN